MWGREHHLYSHGCWLWTYYSTSVTLANDNTSVQTAQLSAARTSMGWLTTSLSINPFGPDRTWSRVEQTGTLCSSRFKMTSNPYRITPSHALPNLENRKILKKTPNPPVDFKYFSKLPDSSFTMAATLTGSKIKVSLVPPRPFINKCYPLLEPHILQLYEISER